MDNPLSPALAQPILSFYGPGRLVSSQTLTMRRAAALASLAAVVTSLVAIGRAEASTLIDRNARNVRLAVDGHGRAVVHYRDGQGRIRHVLAWGARKRIG